MIKHLYLGALVVLLASCRQKTENTSKDETGSEIKVITGTVSATKVSDELKYSGTVEPSQSVALTFKSTGTVEKVLVEEGDFVKKGQALAILNSSNAQNLFNVSQASYEQAKDAYDRLKSVYENGSLTDMKWVEMETKLKQAESQMMIARSNLDDCILKAPDNGMIGSRNIEPGQSALSLTAPFVLVKIDQIEVKIAVPENEISKFSKGLMASFIVSAIGDQAFTGKVKNVGIVADRISRTYEIKIIADNPGQVIKPGMVCDVKVQLSESNKTMMVPVTSVGVDENGKTYVWKVDPAEKRVTRKEVQTGKYNQSGIEIISGLNVNDIIVVEGKEKLSDNSTIVY